MATETVINRPAPFVEDIGKKLSEQALGLQNVPVVTTGIGGLSQQAGETAAGFKSRQDAARAFTTRQQNLSGIAPEVASQDALQQEAQKRTLSGLGSFQPFLNQAQTQAGLDATREATRQAAFQPQEELDRYAGRVAGIMGGYPGQTQTTNIPNPTPLQTALGVGTTLAGIYGATRPGAKTTFGFPSV